MLRKSALAVRQFSIFLLVGMALCVMAHVPASAVELPAGTIINKANLDKIWNDTFQGKTIGSMLTFGQVHQIRNWALQMKIVHTEMPKLSKGFIAATKRYAKDVKFDPKTREVTGYKAGMPFPDISMDDPYAGDKVIWNHYYCPVAGNNQHAPHTWLLINADRGLERREDWHYYRIYMKGRLENGANNPVLGDGKILQKTLFFAEAPYDLRGIGVFTIQYDSEKFDDAWVYVKSVRRVRRLGGGNWMDPINGFDQLHDDLMIVNARPSRYKSWKILRKRTILALASGYLNYVKGAPTLEQEFPLVDLKNWPHWNFSTLNGWEPREVWELEGIPPSYHPYSKKIVYADTSYPVIYFGEGYDKKDKLWKFVNYPSAPLNKANAHLHRGAAPTIPPPNDDESVAVGISFDAQNIDFGRRHASHAYVRLWEGSEIVTSEDVSLGHLEAAGK